MAPPPSMNYAEVKRRLATIGWKILSPEKDYSSPSRHYLLKCKCGAEVHGQPVVVLKGKGHCRTCRTQFGDAPKRTIVTRDGAFPTVAAAASHYGVSYAVFHARLTAGWSHDACAGLELPEHAEVSRDLDAIGYIYLITNATNGKVYVGLTSRTVKTRFEQHKLDARNGSSRRLAKAIRRFGETAFSVKKLVKAPLRELPDLERHFIEVYDSRNPRKGYNSVAGGSLGGTNLGLAVSHDGKTFHSKQAFSDHYGLNYNLCIELFSSGMSPDQVIAECEYRSTVSASERVSTKMGTKVIVNGTEYRSIRAACRALGIDNNTVTRRLHAGWSIDDAFLKESFTRSTSPNRG